MTAAQHSLRQKGLPDGQRNFGPDGWWAGEWVGNPYPDSQSPAEIRFKSPNAHNREALRRLFAEDVAMGDTAWVERRASWNRAYD